MNKPDYIEVGKFVKLRDGRKAIVGYVNSIDDSNHAVRTLCTDGLYTAHALDGAFIKREKHSLDIIGPWIEPAPKQRVPCGPEDFPPGTVVRQIGNEGSWTMVTGVDSDGIYIDAVNQRQSKSFSWTAAQRDLERSIDGGKTWLPCWKEE